MFYKKMSGLRVLVVSLIVVVLCLGDTFTCFAQSKAAGAAQPQGTAEVSMPSPGNVTVNFKDVDILTVLNYLSEVSGVDIIPSPGVKGQVTMRLRNKPWEVALDIITRNYGFAYSREADIIRVMPRSMLQAEDTVTEVIPLNHIIRDIELVRRLDLKVQEVARKETAENIQQLMNAINSTLDKEKGESATFIPSANALVITAIPAKIGSIKAMVEKLDTKTPQILLDAKVIEVTLKDTEKLGIDWNTVITAAGAKRPTTFPFTNQGLFQFLPGDQRSYYPENGEFPPIDTTTGVSPFDPTINANAFFSYGTIDFSTFQATLRLLDQRGDTEILSSPRITTLNNQKATIKVIQKIMLQKTQETTQTAEIVTVEFEKEEDAREVGIKLTIVPHVNVNGDITVNLMPEVSTNTGFQVLEVGPDQNAISLTFDSREANTQVRVRDGETIFIGGLIRENTEKTDNRFPVLGNMFNNIPILDQLFKYKGNVTTKTEIVFFVTVHLIKDSMESFAVSRTNEYYKKYRTIPETPLTGLDEIVSTPAQATTGIPMQTAQSAAEPVQQVSVEKTRKPLIALSKKGS